MIKDKQVCRASLAGITKQDSRYTFARHFGRFGSADMQDKMVRRSLPFAWELPTIHPSHFTYSSRNSKESQHNLRSLRGRMVKGDEEEEAQRKRLGGFLIWRSCLQATSGRVGSKSAVNLMANINFAGWGVRDEKIKNYCGHHIYRRPLPKSGIGIITARHTELWWLCLDGAAFSLFQSVYRSKRYSCSTASNTLWKRATS